MHLFCLLECSNKSSDETPDHKLISHRGFNLISGIHSPEVVDKIQNFEIRDSDVFVITYPKSGKIENHVADVFCFLAEKKALFTQLGLNIHKYYTKKTRKSRKKNKKISFVLIFHCHKGSHLTNHKNAPLLSMAQSESDIHNCSKGCFYLIKHTVKKQ